MDIYSRKDCFHHATCYLPEYHWEDISGFSKSDLIGSIFGQTKMILRSLFVFISPKDRQMPMRQRYRLQGQESAICVITIREYQLIYHTIVDREIAVGGIFPCTAFCFKK